MPPDVAKLALCLESAAVTPNATNVAEGPDYIAFRIPEGRGLLTVVAPIAKTMIEVIKSRGALPADFVEQLSIVKL